MRIANFEFKVKVDNLDELEDHLRKLNPRYVGEDYQTDTYFQVEEGRLKLRQGNIENSLIHYNRENVAESKLSEVTLYRTECPHDLKDTISKVLPIRVIVNKVRKIYFVDNVKFHFDKVEGLGEFLEVEAIDDSSKFSSEELKGQCNKYFQYFELDKDQLIDLSYSDLLYNKSKNKTEYNST